MVGVHASSGEHFISHVTGWNRHESKTIGIGIILNFGIKSASDKYATSLFCKSGRLRTFQLFHGEKVETRPEMEPITMKPIKLMGMVAILPMSVLGVTSP